jgi:hypothetical protein
MRLYFKSFVVVCSFSTVSSFMSLYRANIQCSKIGTLILPYQQTLQSLNRKNRSEGKKTRCQQEFSLFLAKKRIETAESDETLSTDETIGITSLDGKQQYQSNAKNNTQIISRLDFLRDSLSNQVQESKETSSRRNLIINSITVALLGAVGVSSGYLFKSTVYTPPGFRRIFPTQYIAALGDPTANSGIGATEWGLWSVDPGPRGVYIRDYEKELVANNYENSVYKWKFNKEDWWVEEHGIIMESPKFPLPPGRYLVTGGRMVTTGLTINSDGQWKLDDSSTLYDVTHLPCRSARYTTPAPDSGIDNNCSPEKANLRSFPVTPGATMPNIFGCSKQDYAVLFLIGKEA